ncbi:DUF4367 domain-containing protein [Anaerostipes sp.]|uniref:DUF4367 domain-containing protein n=1 Tax=Anaerostipes sp. TaxID=1872530 RepID=UPI0025C2DFBF|nr:DUF4367 domain-containing protein [Anaerostipes sp.]MBS7009524.1 DUF4367 domain-containing protein [Anaerostipes sp.]
MSTKDKKDRSEEMFDQMIKYGTNEWADDISPDDIPEDELSDQMNEKMNTMFVSARKKANRKRRFVTARRVAAVFLVFLTVASITVMSVDAFREPVLNFIFKTTNQNNRIIKVEEDTADPDFTFNYIPSSYHFSKKTVAKNGTYFIYEYKDKQDNYLYIQITSDTSFESYVNIDKTEYIKFVDKNTEYYYLKGTYKSLLWYNNKCIYKIYSKEAKNKLLKIAEGIKY